MGTGGHLGPGMMVLVEEGGSDTSAHSSELVLIFLQNSQKRSSPTENPGELQGSAGLRMEHGSGNWEELPDLQDVIISNE